MSEQFLSVLENEVQLAALAVFGMLYALKLAKMFRLPVAAERAAPRAPKAGGVLMAFAFLVMPWAMESTRRHWIMYVEFVLFHLGIACAIAASFIFPYAPGWLDGPLTPVFLAVMAPALIMGAARMIRRIARPEMRAISSPDDYFANAVLTTYLASALWALATQAPAARATFFGLTTFLLLYLPFSKMSHYLFYPFTRYFFGAYFARRGALPRGLRGVRP